jgi:protein TonB
VRAFFSQLITKKLVIMKTSFSSPSLEEIVFTNRNRSYGAYALRQGYRRTLRRAFLLGVSGVSLGLIGPSVWRGTGADEARTVTLADPMNLPQPTPEEPVVTPPPPPEPAVEVPQATTTQFLPPDIKPDIEVVEEVPVATQEELQQAQAGETTQLGDVNAGEIVVDPSAGTGKPREAVVEIKPSQADETFLAVEQMPEFPGGPAALRAFLEKNIRYPAQAARGGIGGRVYLRFIVGPDGRISDVVITKGLGFGCDEEALRVVKAMPRWTPGRQSGRAVRTQFTLPIVFALE